MQKIITVKITLQELPELINQSVKRAIKDSFSNPKKRSISLSSKPHLTRKETAKFFGVSLNCINDWSNKRILKPKKVGQRTYSKKTDISMTLFGKEDKQKNQDQ